jgi:hypothetical protein
VKTERPAQARQLERNLVMHSVIYIVGLVVVVMAVLSFVGLS